MKRIMLNSSLVVATTSKHSSRKPWHILQCHTRHHASETSSQSERHTMLRVNILWPFPFQQSFNTIEEGMHGEKRRQWSHYPPFTRHPINGFGFPSLKGTESGLTSDMIEVRKTKRILELAHLYALKDRLQKETTEVMAYDDLLKMCVRMGVASSTNEATQLVKCLDDASLILILPDIVLLNPRKVAQLVSNVIPASPSQNQEREGVHQELYSLKEEKENIDKLSYKFSRRILWLGFGYLTLQMLLIFRLTFWDLSWDVMEPIAYFVTNITLLLGYVFFMITSKHPTYQNLGATLHSSKQRKLMKGRNFDMAKLLELHRQCPTVHTSLGSTTVSH